MLYKHLSYSRFQINVLKNKSDLNRKQYLQLKMVAEEEVILLRQQLIALRSALKLSEKEGEHLRKELDKEVSLMILVCFSTG